MLVFRLSRSNGVDQILTDGAGVLIVHGLNGLTQSGLLLVGEDDDFRAVTVGLPLFEGLFIVIGGIKSAGVIDVIGNGIAKLGSGSEFIIYTIIVWISVILSAFIDNIPYTATMLTIVPVIAADMGMEPKLLYYGLLCGATLAVVNFGKLMLFDRLGIFVSLTVSLTLLATVVVAKFFGCTLPLLVKKIGLDPAVMASPIITTIVDAIALLIYFAIASAMLGI